MSHEHPPHSRDDWDTRYAESERIWSGNPNGLLVSELAGTGPGPGRDTVLDVGCGEGADAIWLAQQGWTVTALDISTEAVGRARAAAEDAGVELRWVESGLVEAGTGLGTFDLVSVFYPAFLKDRGAEAAMMQAVRPGGELLFVHHADLTTADGRAQALERGFDPLDYVQPDDLLTALRSAGWEVLLDDVRDRAVAGGAGAHHHVDRVVRARCPEQDTG